MARETNEYYEKALLAMAAYAENGSKDSLKNDAGFSDVQADQFLEKYEYLSKSPDTISGFSGTFYRVKTGENAGQIVFALRGTNPPSLSVDGIIEFFQDLASDVDLGVVGVAPDQIMDMVNFYLRAITPASSMVKQYRINTAIGVPAELIEISEAEGLYILGLDADTKLTITGHSLAGHLAQAFTRIFPSAVRDAYTYNGAGINSGINGLDVLTDLLSSISDPISIIPGASADNLVANLIAEPGAELTAIIGNHLGASPEMLFIEKGIQGDILTNHSVKSLTDSLAVYDMLSNMDNSLSIADISSILYRASNTSALSLEYIVNVTTKLLGISSPVIGLDDRDTLYSVIESVSTSVTENNYSIQIISSSIAELATQNTDLGRGYRYALVNLLPFAITSNLAGTAADDPQYDAANFSAAYLADRAQMLELLITRNTLDITTSDSLDENQEDTLYIDQTTNLKLTTGAISLIGVTDSTTRIYFGDESTNVSVVGIDRGKRERIYFSA